MKFTGFLTLVKHHVGIYSKTQKLKLRRCNRSNGRCGHTQIDYFNNQIIVDLVEQPHKGIISILDEACLTVGKVTDTVCLDSMDTKLAQHPHYTSRKVRTVYLTAPPQFTSCGFEHSELARSNSSLSSGHDVMQP